MTDPIAARPPRPAPSSLLLKAAVVLPDVAIATLLWLVIIAALPPAVSFGVTLAGLTLAALPPAVGFGVTLVGLALAAILAAGLGEHLTVRLPYRARRATPAEAPRLAVAWRLATHGRDADGVRLRIVPHGPPVGTAGCRHVLLRRDVVDAFCANQVTARQVAGLIADGLGRLRHGHVRFDLLWTVWTIPWDLIRGAAYAIGRRLAWIPLVQFAWRTRLVVGTIAVILEAQAGRWPSPIIIATFIGLSYLLPRWQEAWQRHLTGLAARSDAPLPVLSPARS